MLVIRVILCRKYGTNKQLYKLYKCELVFFKVNFKDAIYKGRRYGHSRIACRIIIHRCGQLIAARCDTAQTLLSMALKESMLFVLLQGVRAEGCAKSYKLKLRIGFVFSRN